MKKLFILFCFLPVFGSAQIKKGSNKAKSQSPTELNQPNEDGFTITGKIKGLEDGTTVEMLSNAGVLEANTVVENGVFVLKGKVPFPDFKALTFNKKQPYVTFFLDNSDATLMGEKSTIEKSVLYGSKSNDEYKEIVALTAPFDEAMSNHTALDNDKAIKISKGLEGFVTKHPTSYMSPFAIYKLHQMTENAEQMMALFGGLSKEVQTGPIGNFIAQQIAEIRRNPMGKVLDDFSQADPNGKMISLSSLRGQYVLVDFWASWCGPCRNENPNVVRAYQEFKDKGFTVLGVSLDKDKQKWLDAVAADGLTWTHVSDLKGWGNEVAQKFGISSIPQNFLLDPDGKVIGKNLRGEALDQKLKSILK